MENNGALSGITVLDLSRLLPGPYCSMILADHGARVISLEDKRYRSDTTFYVKKLYRNKEHMTLDLKKEAGRYLFYSLVRDADVVLEGFRPGVVERLGVDYETLRKINPRIIYCAITGYGQNGPLRDKAGHDVNYLSRAGVLDLIGEPGKPPVIPVVQIADIMGGSMNAVTGILLALYARERTGEGQYIDISMTDGALGLMMLPLHFNDLLGETPCRGDFILSHRYAFYNTYETADGRHIAIGALEPQFWKRLCDFLGVPQYIPLQYDDSHRQEIIDFMREVFLRKRLGEWEKILAELDICCSPVRNMKEVMEDSLFRENGTIVEVEDENGAPAATIGVPVKLSHTPGAVRKRPPSFGGDTASILGALGYSAKEIQRLSDRDVI